MIEPNRPVLRWHGGKWMLAPWIIEHFPDHRIYVEPFGGAASVLLRKRRVYAEVYNDLDDCVVNLFRVLRNPDQADHLIRLLQQTPFSRTEFDAAYEISDDPVEEARRLIIRSGTTPAHDWANYPDSLAYIVARLAGVVVENRDAVEVMLQHDSVATLHYVDPPYLPETRSLKFRNTDGRANCYRHELDGGGQLRLLEALRDLRGMVVLSGYPSPVYDDALPGWLRVERPALADGARERTEVLWINPRAADRLGQPSLLGLGEVA
jgi:DNA adenine methylase